MLKLSMANILSELVKNRGYKGSPHALAQGLFDELESLGLVTINKRKNGVWEVEITDQGVDTFFELTKYRRAKNAIANPEV